VVFGFVIGSAPQGVEVMTDIDKYLDFVITMFLAFGVTFEVPIVVVALAVMGVVEVAKFKEMRPYVVVGAFVIGAIFTPPDVISQTMLAIPLWFLYELGVFVAAWLVKRKKSDETSVDEYRPMTEEEIEAELNRD
jgi:sec-independent protein translocase protein TatC